jgi:pyruvate formate lyase activating enzyme
VDNQGKGSGEFSPEELLQEVLRYKNFIRTGGVTATGGEPLMQAEFLREFFRLCKNDDIHTCLDTSGAIFNEKAKAVMDYTDLVMLDLKTLDDNLHKSYTGATRDNNHRWMEYLQEIGKPTWIRHVVVPTITDNEERLQAVADYVSQFSCIERVELLGYHIMGEAKYKKMGIPYPLEGIPPLSPERLNEIREIFAQKLSIKVL